MQKQMMLSLLLVAVASSASAMPTISASWRSSGTSVLDPVNDAPDKLGSRFAGLDVYYLDLSLTTGATPITGVFFSIGFDDAELQYRGGSEFSSVPLGKSSTFAPINLGVTQTAPGLVSFFDSIVRPITASFSGTVTLGSLAFTAFGGVDDGQPDVNPFADVPGLIDAIIGENGVNLTGMAVFESASVVSAQPQPQLPEPTSGLLLVCGLVGLIAAGRRGSADRDGR